MKHQESFLSDRDKLLLGRQFRIKKPETLPRLLATIPADIGMPEIEYYYSEKGKNRPKIRCSHCHRTLHWKGYVVKFANGDRALIGKDCGREQFGFAFTRVEDTFTDLTKRHDALRRFTDVAALLPAALDELKHFESSGSLTAFDTYVDTLRRKFGHFGRLLAKSVRSSQGRLVALEEVRDLKKEQAEARRRDDDTGGVLQAAIDSARTSNDRRLAVQHWNDFVARLPPIWTLQPIDMGECAAWRVLTPPKSPKALVAEAISLLKVAQQNSQVRTSDQWSLSGLERFPVEIGRALDLVDHALHLLSELQRFTHPTNIERLSAWAQQVESSEGSIRQRLVAEGRALRDVESSIKLEIADGLAILPLPKVAALRNCTSGKNDG